VTDKLLTVSWSRLKAYESCRQQVLRRKEKKSNFSPSQARVFLPGTIADRCTRWFLELEDPQPGQILEKLDEMFEKYAFHDEQYVIKWKGDPLADQKKVKENVRTILLNLEPMLWDFVLPHGYQAEVKFREKVAIPDADGNLRFVELIGGMDILVATLNGLKQTDDDSEYSVYDLKATFDDSYVRGEILAQLIFYALVVKVMFGKYPKNVAFLTPGCKQKYVPLQVTPDDVRIMMSRVVSYCQGVWAEQWQPKDEPDGDCSWCDVKHACELFHIEPGKRVSFMEMAARRKK
jgi:hypothetical protein